MSKPDWKDAPDWANYLAQDENGSWTWFETEPTMSKFWWYDGGEMETVSGTAPGWESSLEPRP